MRMIIIAIAALVVVGGGAAGAYFYFSGSKAEAAIHEDADAAKKESKAAKGEHGEAGAPVTEYVELDTLILPIVDNDGVSQTVSLVIALEVHDAASSIKVKEMKPKITDAFIQDLYGALNEQAALQGGVIQVQMVKKRLNEITKTVVGENVVHDVLLQVVQQRPI